MKEEWKNAIGNGLVILFFVLLMLMFMLMIGKCAKEVEQKGLKSIVEDLWEGTDSNKEVNND